MKKKPYEKPTLEVLEFKMQLLEGSTEGFADERENYDDGGDPFAGY